MLLSWKDRDIGTDSIINIASDTDIATEMDMDVYKAIEKNLATVEDMVIELDGEQYVLRLFFMVRQLVSWSHS